MIKKLPEERKEKDETIKDNTIEKMNGLKQAIYYNLLFSRMGLVYEVDEHYLLGEGQEDTFSLMETFIMFYLLSVTKTGAAPQMQASSVFNEKKEIYEFYLNGKVFDPRKMYSRGIISPEEITTKESYDEKSYFIMGKYYDKEMNFDEVFHQLMLDAVPAWKKYREE